MIAGRRAVALALAAVSTDVEIVHVVTGAYNPVTGTAARTETPWTGTVKVMTVSELAGDRRSAYVKALIPAAGPPFVPQDGDRLRVSGETLRIYQVGAVYVGDTITHYECEASR